MLLGKERVASREEVVINRFVEVVISYKYFVSCFNCDGGAYEDVGMRVGEGLKFFGAMKKTCLMSGV